MDHQKPYLKFRFFNSISRFDVRMELGDRIEQSIKNSLRNIVPKQAQSIQMSMNQSYTMMNPPLKMVQNALLNVVALESLHVIENGKRKIFVRDGTKLDE